MSNPQYYSFLFKTKLHAMQFYKAIFENNNVEFTVKDVSSQKKL